MRKGAFFFMAWYNTRIGGKIADFFDSAAGDVAMTFFVPFGFIKTGKDMYDSAKEAARAQEEAEKQSRISGALNGDISSLPYIKGAKNTTATGKTQPYIIGRHLFTPYIMNGGGGAYKGWHKIGGNCGSEQYYGVVLEGGFSKQVLECLNIGDVKAADFSGDAEPQEGVRRFKADSVFASPESFIEISQDGNGFEHEELNRKIVETEANAQLKNADDDDYEDLIYTLDKNAMSCDVIIMFNGLYAVGNDGKKTEKKRTVVPSWSSDYLDLTAQGKSADEATWHEFKFKQATEETNVSYKTSYYTAGDVKATGYQSKGSIKLTDSKKNDFINRNRASWTKNLLADKSSWTLAGGEDIKDGENVTYDVTYTYKTYKKNPIGHTYYVYFTPQIKATQRVETKTESATLSNDFSYNRQSQIRFSAHADFSFSDCFDVSEDESGNSVYTRKGPIAIRISTADTKDDKARGDCYVQYVQSTCCNEAASKASGALVPEKVVADREARLSTLIGVYIKATEANKDKLDKISVVTNGTAPYLDENGEWAKDSSGELLRRPTSNIAAWTLEILTSSTHAPSKMESGEIDLDTFRKWHEYCDEYGLFVNKVLTGGAQKESLLASLAEAGRAVLYQDTDGRISVAWDRIQDKPKMLLNAENMVSFSWKKDLSRQPDGVKMTFVESEGDVYDTDSIIRMYEQFSPDGEDQWADSENRSYDAQIKEIEGYGITGHEQVYAYMDYVMRCARLRLKDASCQIGKEGAFLRPYDRVSVQHWAIGRGDGSTRVKKVIVNALGSITGVETYDPVMMGAGESFYAQIQCTGGDSVSIAAVSAKAEKTRGNEILFTRVFTGKISAGDIVSYGASENIVTEDFIVRSAQPSGKGYALTLTEYDERIFETGEIPDYESPLSLNGDVRRVNIPESVPEYTSDELNTAIISVTSPYVHVVYCDDPETGENYSTSETRAYVGTYSDTETEAAGTFEDAKGKPGIKWAKFVDTEAAKAAEEAAREAANVVTHGAHFTTMHRIKDYDTNLSIENIQRKIDADFEELSSGMSMTEAELHWFTEKTDAERGTKTTTEINAKAGELQTLIKETDETNRTDTASEIKQTASEIKTSVGEEFFNEDGTPITDKDGNIVKVGSVIKQTADEIYSYVGNDGADGKPKSGIFQTADAIQASVEKETETRAGETKALGEKADGIDKDLQDTKEEYTSFKSTITQTADAIQAAVKESTKKFEQLYFFSTYEDYVAISADITAKRAELANAEEKNKDGIQKEIDELEEKEAYKKQYVFKPAQPNDNSTTENDTTDCWTTKKSVAAPKGKKIRQTFYSYRFMSLSFGKDGKEEAGKYTYTGVFTGAADAQDAFAHLSQSSAQNQYELKSFRDGEYAALSRQVDGKIQTWYQSADPAEGWTSAAAKAAHEGDLWYCTDSGDKTRYHNAYRYTKNSEGVFSWALDNSAPDALFDVIDGKMSVHTTANIETLPTVPYNAGDLWFPGTEADIMVCKTSKGINGTAEAADWEKQSMSVTDLSAKVDVQGGAVQALVAGGGSDGYLGLSIELPVIIWGSKYESIKDSLEKSQKLQEDDKKKERTEAVKLLESVYVKTDDKEKRLASDGKGYYTISEDASASDCRKLFDYMKKAGLLASQFKVSADQMEFSVDKDKGLISFNGQTIFSSGQTSAEIDNAKTAAVEAAATDATTKAGNAEENAKTDAADKQNAIAEKLGYVQSKDASAWDNMVKAAGDGDTVIKGGYINTTLISAKSIDVDGSGFFQKVHSYDTPESNFWDLSTGEFRIGNDISLEDSSTGLPKKTGNGATYIHFNPKGSRFTLALTKFVLSSIASIIKGVFKVNADSESGIGSDFLTVNPDEQEFDGVPAKAVSVKGDIIAHGKSSGDTSAKNHVLSRLTDKEFDSMFSIS